MIIIAWDGSGQPTSIFEAIVFKKVLSISLTAAILNFGQGMFITANVYNNLCSASSTTV